MTPYEIQQEKGRLTDAERLLQESLAIKKRLGDKVGEAVTLTNLGIVALYRGDINRAIARFQESIKISRDLGDKLGEAFSLYNLGLGYQEQMNWEQALWIGLSQIRRRQRLAA